MSIPTIQEALSRYIFFTITSPVDLKSDSFIRPSFAVGHSIYVNVTEFMTADASRRALVAVPVSVMPQSISVSSGEIEGEKRGVDLAARFAWAEVRCG